MAAITSEPRAGSPDRDEGTAPLAAVPGLLRLRWVTVGGLALILVVLTAAFEVSLPTGRLALLIAAMAATNLALARAVARARPIGRGALGAVFGLDIVLLTATLQLTGGPANPLSVLYLVPVTVAAVSLGRGWTWLLTALSIAGFGALFVWSLPLPSFGAAHVHAGPMSDHLLGMWLAFVAAALVIAYFVERATRALAERERELAALRATAARNERLASLTTLAAGAAHELATPLATIAVAAHELERAAAGGADAAEVLDDARLIRAEVDRCHEILDQLSGRASGATVAEGPLDLADLVARVRRKLSPAEADRLDERCALATSRAALPGEALARILGSLVRNAFEATPAPRRVALAAGEEGGSLRFTVRDEGLGMPPEVLARAGEPFFTTKQPGGFGLGLFLARHFAEEFGGVLRLTSVPGAGTTAVLEFPLEPRARP
jgi:two-component system sensor histidine kinase RegB